MDTAANHNTYVLRETEQPVRLEAVFVKSTEQSSNRIVGTDTPNFSSYFTLCS